MGVEALRDHAGAMLDAIASDLETPQTEEQRKAKAQGGSRPQNPAGDMSAASMHGRGRAESGFSIESMFAEFRALRASVISLWRKQLGAAGPDDLEDLTRFDEAIDQAIAESLVRYSREVDATRDRFFAVLGHDLRTPLGAIITSTQFLLETATLTGDQRTIVAGMERSGRRMTELIRDLLDLALTRLGRGIPVDRGDVDLAELAREVVVEARASTPESRIQVDASGDVHGQWDRARLGQALTNLVGNAMQHGWRDTPIMVRVRGDTPESASISVTNAGPPIPEHAISGLFAAMKAGSNRRGAGHLGLGLYIVDKIVEAHCGHIDVRSSAEEGTTFTVTLPRRAPSH